MIRSLRPAGGSLLQFSCGEGDLLKLLAPSFDVHGYDDAALVRHRCRTNVPHAVVFESVEEIPASAFDIVVWQGAIPRRQALALVRHLAEPLAPGGFLALIVPNLGGLAHRLKGERWSGAKPGASSHLPSQGEWAMVLRRAGFEVASVRSDGLWDAPYLPLIPAEWQRAMFGAPLALSSYLPLSRWLLPPAVGESLVLAARRKS